MLKFYYSGAPNPTKVALFLEEAGLPYEAIAVDTRKGDQHKPDFLKLNPNAKVPVIVDGDTTVFDSSAILLYLAKLLIGAALLALFETSIAKMRVFRVPQFLGAALMLGLLGTLLLFVERSV